MNNKDIKRKRMFENIYDILGNTKFKNEAENEMRKFIKNKSIEWDGDNNIISLGKHFRFQLLK